MLYRHYLEVLSVSMFLATQMRRAEKKATKLAFRSEELKLEKALAVRLPTAAVV